MNSDSTGGFAGLDNSQRSPTRRSVRDFWLSSFVLAGLVISLLAAAGCDGLFPAQTKVGPPDDHTEAKGGGVMHKKGSEHPDRLNSGCTDSKCHQADLRGGLAEVDGRAAEAPSCYQCHGNNWDDDDDDDDLPAPLSSHTPRL